MTKWTSAQVSLAIGIGLLAYFIIAFFAIHMFFLDYWPWEDNPNATSPWSIEKSPNTGVCYEVFQPAGSQRVAMATVECPDE